MWKLLELKNQNQTGRKQIMSQPHSKSNALVYIIFHFHNQTVKKGSENQEAITYYQFLCGHFEGQERHQEVTQQQRMCQPNGTKRHPYETRHQKKK